MTPYANRSALVSCSQTAMPAEDAPTVINENCVTKNGVPSLDGDLAVHSGGCADRQFLFVGDSIVRFVPYPKWILSPAGQVPGHGWTYLRFPLRAQT